ncbi:putative toxin-antitoxin system toxin component, PIN family [Candidatus Fermentibacteria bacterium]|nr:MAG: putative toxin-antitoxin system toxin component, PIN family [Candidatus Fermentibacteria bacterium]
MRVVVDTNVLISGVFFGGKPGQIPDALQKRKIELVISTRILAEYIDVLHRIAAKYPKVDVSRIITLITSFGLIIEARDLEEQVCEDSDDDKFIAAALESSSKVIITGDTHLLDVSGYSGIEMIQPAVFIEKYLSE